MSELRTDPASRVAYDTTLEQFTAVDCDAPDVLLMRAEEGHGYDLDNAADMQRERAWRMLAGYVLLNQGEMPEACARLGKLALELKPSLYAPLMTAAEIKAVGALGTARWRRCSAPLRVRMTFLVSEHLRSLRAGMGLAEVMAAKDLHDALRALLLAAWRPAGTMTFRTSLVEAFRCYLVQAQQDTRLMAAVTQTEIGLAFSQTRAAVSALAQREVRGRLESAGMSAQIVGGKSAEAIAKYAAVQKGNTNRASATWTADERAARAEQRERERFTEDHADAGADTPVKAEFARMSARQLRAHLDALAEAEDRRRLGV